MDQTFFACIHAAQFWWDKISSYQIHILIWNVPWLNDHTIFQVAEMEHASCRDAQCTCIFSRWRGYQVNELEPWKSWVSREIRVKISLKTKSHWPVISVFVDYFSLWKVTTVAECRAQIWHTRVLGQITTTIHSRGWSCLVNTGYPLSLQAESGRMTKPHIAQVDMTPIYTSRRYQDIPNVCQILYNIH